jgi:hypothetical protein
VWGSTDPARWSGWTGDPRGGGGGEGERKQIYFIRTNLSGDADNDKEVVEDVEDGDDNDTKLVPQGVKAIEATK